MALAAGMVRVPGANEVLGAKGNESAKVPELVVTRLEWLPAGGEARERLRLLDPTPLFMPGARLVRDRLGGAEGLADRPSGDTGEAIPPALVFPEENPARGIGRASTPATPLAGVEIVMGARWFEGMARADPNPRGVVKDPLTPTSAGRLDVYRLGEARRMADLALPPDMVLEAATWRPLEMSVLVPAAGAITVSTVTRSSGVEEVDERVRTLVVRELLQRLLLRPGAYRLVVGP
jgi:hypothetical protein